MEWFEPTGLCNFIINSISLSLIAVIMIDNKDRNTGQNWRLVGVYDCHT